MAIGHIPPITTRTSSLVRRPSGLTIADCAWAFGLWLAVNESRQNADPCDSLMQKMFSFDVMSIFTMYVAVTRHPVIRRGTVLPAAALVACQTSDPLAGSIFRTVFEKPYR